MVRHAHLALIVCLVMALVVLVFPANLMARNAGGDTAGTDQSFSTGQATGLREPTSTEKEWVKKNFPVIREIRLNRLALERINNERGSKGLKKLSESELVIAPSGNEALFASISASDTGTGTGVVSLLPNSVDNSQSPAFPPIRSQGGIGSCAAWATTYYQFTYENNLARGTTASDDTKIFSPKWTYNMINGGVDGGAYFSAAYAVEMKNGAATWAEFPYDTNYLAWPLNASTWRNALNYRPLSWGQISNSNVDLLMGDLKTQLANGHVVVIATYVSSWVQKVVGNDPSIIEDDALAGQKIAGYMKNTYLGGHAMTMVGYNDDLWCDLNGNGLVDSGEKGAFKIANSWGTGDWNSGYRWVSYDALRSISAAPSSGTWPTADRGTGGIFWSGNYFTLTARGDYFPTMLAEVTLNQAARGQMSVSLGTSGTATAIPTSTWTSGAVNYAGGNWAFNGTSTAVDGTFVFDYSDLAPAGNTIKRWFVGIRDNTAGNAATIKSFKLYQAGSSGDTLLVNCTDMPKSVDASQIYSWIDYSDGSTNQSPVAAASASPTSGSIPLTVGFDGGASMDPDGTIMSYSWNFGDSSSGTGPQVSHIYTSAGTFTSTLTVTDDKGATASTSLVINATDPSNIVAPTNLLAIAGKGAVKLTWSDNSSNESGFYVERSIKLRNGYSSYTQLVPAGPNATSYTDAVSSGNYKYRVRAFNATTGKVSAYSNEVTVRVK